MKKSIIFFFLFICTQAFSQLTVDALRKEYHKASSDSVACSKLYAKAFADNSTDNMIIGYKGAISAAMANHIKNKSEKLKFFNAGKKLIEQSIKADAQNMELRFLRFTIQTNCPKALGYNDEIESDKKFVMESLGSMKNATLKKKMIAFLLASKYVTEEEKKKLNTENAGSKG